jgi:hypothetical protein
MTSQVYLDDGQNDETVASHSEETEEVEKQGQAPLLHLRLLTVICQVEIIL